MPDRPALVTVPNVELAEVGTWDCSTGRVTFTVEDFAAAVAAQDDPAVPTPVVRLGHVDPRFDGEPAVGRIENVRLSADSMTLVGDLVGVPAWLAEVMASAYPRRSVEGWHNATTATGSTHRFMVTGLALLGVTVPAIGTLADIAALYQVDQVAASAGPAGGGEAVAVTLAAKEPPVPPIPVAAAVNVDDIRAAFYDTAPPGSWAWIREMYVGTNAYIIVDDDGGNLFQIPWSEADGTITFGTPVRVAVTYVAAPAEPAVDDAALVLLARFRPLGGQAVTASAPPTGPQGQQGEHMDPVLLRISLGLAEDATDEDVLARAAELAAAAAAPPAPAAAALPEGVTAIDEGTLAELRTAAAAGREALERQRRDDRDRFLAAAVGQGKFPPARLAHWSGLWDRDPEGTRDYVDKTLAAGTVPVAEVGHAGAGNTEDDALYEQLFGAPAQNGA